MKEDAVGIQRLRRACVLVSFERQVSCEKEKARGPRSPGAEKPCAPNRLADCAGGDHLRLRAVGAEAGRLILSLPLAGNWALRVGDPFAPRAWIQPRQWIAGQAKREQIMAGGYPGAAVGHQTVRRFACQMLLEART
jgi:hypothetical protein